MKKIIKLTESDLTRIVKRVIKENETNDVSLYDEYNEILNRLMNELDLIDDCEELERLSMDAEGMLMDISMENDLEDEYQDNLFDKCEILLSEIYDKFHDICNDDEFDN